MSRILITGASGMIGRALVRSLEEHEVIATDLAPAGDLPPHVSAEKLDVTGEDAGRVIARHRPEVIVHLASIVTPSRGMSRDAAFAVDVKGTQNVLTAALDNGVRRLVVTSSGAAYGYDAANPVPLRETDPLRGNAAFPYAHHKRLVEEMLAEARRSRPELEQVVLRVGTVLGEGTDNQITALFHKPRLLAVRGCDSPFVFVWTEDLACILRRAATDGPAGIFNVAGDGAMGIEELARALGKPVLHLPAALLRAALAVARPLRLSRYGPEQVCFLQHRPVLANDALKSDFGYVPQKTSREVFEHWKQAEGL
ncbi:SDR family oxidoreductase [Sedimentitalea todarodis]|uniref:SDR family oxidoreductase n=1 Tax=Sedimentitalea todarodis TaxID=1631240 RepID=A0ABU3VCM7_9RHOB|nr:SDR family oxidoreductase [Sedimentitalea todarodis]MDU9003933.1 SDR family oxidoreductase [Sedimentitalea todarodis]